MTEITWLYMSGYGGYVWSVVILCAVLVGYEVIQVRLAQRQCERIQRHLDVLAQSKSSLESKGDV